MAQRPKDLPLELQSMKAEAVYQHLCAATSTVLLKPNGDIQMPLVDGFGFRTMSSDFCYVASVHPSLPPNMTYLSGRSIFVPDVSTRGL